MTQDSSALEKTPGPQTLHKSRRRSRVAQISADSPKKAELTSCPVVWSSASGQTFDLFQGLQTISMPSAVPATTALPQRATENIGSRVWTGLAATRCQRRSMIRNEPSFFCHEVTTHRSRPIASTRAALPSRHECSNSPLGLRASRYIPRLTSRLSPKGTRIDSAPANSLMIRPLPSRVTTRSSYVCARMWAPIAHARYKRPSSNRDATGASIVTCPKARPPRHRAPR